MKFKYKSDEKRDTWTLMHPDKGGVMRGDCEDYSLRIAYDLAGQNIWKVFWGVLTRRYKFHQVRTREGWVGHCILEYKNMFTDNNFQKWVDKKDMEKVYKFKHRIILTTILLKLDWKSIFKGD